MENSCVLIGTFRAESGCACAENTSANEGQPGNTRKSQDSRQGGQASLATIDSLASSIEERKISNGSSLPLSSLPQPLTPRTAALLQRVSEAAAGRQGSRLKPTDSGPAESSGEVAPPVLGAVHHDMELQTPNQGNTLAGDSNTQKVMRQDASAGLVGGLAQGLLAEAQPAQTFALASTSASGDALLDQSRAAQPEKPSVDFTTDNGVEDAGPTREQAQPQALSQKRPAKATPPSLEEHQPQSPKRHRKSGKASFCTAI
ncbi:g3817 [Coccomyxa viridis]|uniref:G3817 protein n=1 Tax=Coccomyxa viridis TaxID=1274662 RepID=A0ABP1FVM5_9CHLO